MASGFCLIESGLFHAFHLALLVTPVIDELLGSGYCEDHRLELATFDSLEHYRLLAFASGHSGKLSTHGDENAFCMDYWSYVPSVAIDFETHSYNLARRR